MFNAQDAAALQSPTTFRLPRWAFAVGLLLLGLLWFGNLEYRDLVDPDEGRYAEIPREMAASGDWVTPRLNDLKYFEKPPLQYWITAALYSAFGVDEWVARLWPALAGILGVLAAFLTARRLYGPDVGALAALVLGGMLQYVIFSHILTLDMTLALLLSGAVFAFVVAQDDRTAPRDRRAWMLAGWAAMAGAVMTKGLIGVMLPAGAVAAYVLLHRDWALLRRLHLGAGVAVLLALTAPWFIAVSLRNPEFARFFFWHEHVERFLLPEHHRPGAWWYFLAIGLVGTLPWSGLLFSAPRGWWRADDGARFRPTRFLLVWVVVVVAFFSASSSKLPGYIVPVLPALAVLIAVHAARASPRAIALALAAIVPLSLGSTAALPYLAKLKSQPQFELYLDAFLPWLLTASLSLTAALVVASVLAARRQVLGAVACASAGSLVALTLAMTGNEQMSPVYSAAYSGEILVKTLTEDVRHLPFFSVSQFGHSLPFILERPVTLVDYRGELALGVDAEPDKVIATLEKFGEVWTALPDGFAVMSHALYQQFKGEGLPMTVVLEDPMRVFVRRR